MISGGPYRNCCQSIDSPEDSLSNRNRGSRYHISGAIYKHALIGRKWIQFGPSLPAIRVWMGVLRKWRSDVHYLWAPDFVADRLARRHSSPTLIASKDKAFLAQFRHTPGGGWEFTKSGPSLAVIRSCVAAPRKCRM